MYTGDLTETWESTQGLMKTAVKRVFDQVGGELDEMMAETGALFMKAVLTYEEGRKQFTSHLYQVVWHDLFAKRRQALRRRLQPVDSEGLFEMLPHEDGCNYPRYMDLLEKLDDDALELVQLTTNPPKRVQLKVDGTPSIRSLRAYAIEVWQWSPEQFTEASNNIQEALVG